MVIKDYLHALCESSGPSGYEGHSALGKGNSPAEIAQSLIAPFVDETRIDSVGNLIATKKCGKKNAKKFLIAAHLDEVGFVVNGYDDKYLTFAPIGGIDARMLPGRDLVIMTNPPCLGVVCALPPHVLSKEEMEKAVPMEKLRIDAGFSAKELPKKIPIGTIITFRTEGFELGEDLYTSKTLDDRACFVSLIRAAQLLKGRELPWDVVFVGSSAEEVGGSGAANACFAEDPIVCAAIDVTHAKTPDMPPHTQGFDLGKGPTVAKGPNIAKAVGEQLERLAKEKHIPYQLELCPGRTGTDAWAMQIAREGIATGLIGLPLRYMHTPVETVSVTDIELCAELVAEYALNPGEEVQALC